MALAPNDKPLTPSASSQSNIDAQRRQMTETGSTITPQRQNTQDAPLFTHHPTITTVEHPRSRFIQGERVRRGWMKREQALRVHGRRRMTRAGIAEFPDRRIIMADESNAAHVPGM